MSKLIYVYCSLGLSQQIKAMMNVVVCSIEIMDYDSAEFDILLYISFHDTSSTKREQTIYGREVKINVVDSALSII